MRSLLEDAMQQFKNPYRPGAGHMPPHLAGREGEFDEFDRLLAQDTILENMVLTGLRGVGKTVLLETFKPRAVQEGWLWVGADLSESASVSETSLAMRLIADLSVATSAFSTDLPSATPVGFSGPKEPREHVLLTYDILAALYEATPGLVGDKIKRVLEVVHGVLLQHGRPKVVFAYDEAQNLADHVQKEQFPLSVLLDVFQSVQRKGVPFMLVLTGLPTLFPKLVEARTFAERMFRVVTLGRLDENESREATLKPIEVANCPVSFNEESVRTIVGQSAGYPYFIQFICREVFDVFIQQMASDVPPGVPIDAIQHKLDTDFFAGRWAKVTDRQRELLWVIASLDRADDEFSIQEVVERSRAVLPKGFSSSHVNQMLASLSEQGLIYKNRFGRYSFAVPLLGTFIRRTYAPPGVIPE
ncbi:MAG: AAA family ATPase [Actinobacteria bacterium]|nr:AAA family ATPase [Actinomycetota bacterium]